MERKRNLNNKNLANLHKIPAKKVSNLIQLNLACYKPNTNKIQIQKKSKLVLPK